MKTIILGAGIGSRLEEKGKTVPKCLAKVGKETLLERQIRILKDLDIKDITLVIGYQGECWTKENREKIKQIHKKIVVNKKNVDLKRPYSLSCGLKGIEKEEVVVIDGDLVFEKELIKKIIDDKRKNLLLAKYIESRHIEDKGAKIITGENDKVIKAGYGFPSSKLFSGIFKVGKRDFYIFKEIVDRKENWTKNLTAIFEEFAKLAKFYALTVNTSLSLVPQKGVKTTESWEPVTSQIERNGNVIRKKTKTGKQKLINEVNLIQNLPEDIKKHFPKIINYDFDQEIAYYDMEYCPYLNFAELLLQRRIPIHLAFGILKQILDFMFNKVYLLRRKNPPVGFVRYSYYDKFLNRLQGVRNKSDIFDKIINARHLVINDKEYINATILTRNIMEDIKFLSSLEPFYLSLYHGDFKFDNMLIDYEHHDFILIDPRGRTASGLVESDYIEDIAKLRTSCHGLYDFIYNHLFDLKININKQTDINLIFKDKKLLEDFNEIDEKLLEFLPKYSQIKQDLGYHKRLLFIEAMLIIANAPFHFREGDKKSEKVMIALYVRGVQLINEFLEKYPLNVERKFKWININDPAQYHQAQEMFSGEE